MECSDHEEEEGEEPTESSLKEDSFAEEECTENKVHEQLAGMQQKKQQQCQITKGMPQHGYMTRSGRTVNNPVRFRK